MKTLNFVVEMSGRLDRVVPAGDPALSRRQARALIGAGAVYLDGKRCKVASRHTPVGSKIVVHLEVPEPAQPPTILFEDEDIVVVNKPAGLSANESETSPRASVVRSLGANTKLVHRLDVDTTGVMVLARSDRAAAALSELFRNREIEKRYIAVTMGSPAQGWVDAPIGADTRRPRARAVREDGRPARTEVTVLGEAQGLCAVSLKLETGRMHQIRVHLSHLGTPIFGDTQYGAKAAILLDGQTVRAERPMLHARSLSFSLFDVQHRFEAPIPPDLGALWTRLNPDNPSG